MGKTSFALNIARNVAINQNRGVAFFNLEMSREQMVNRLLSSEARVSSKKLRVGNLTPDEWGRIAVASSILCKAPIYLDDTASITVPEMKARLRRQKDVSFVVIDYLQLMKSPTRIDNRVQEVTEITRGIKIMAKELNIPIMVCAQLARTDVYKRQAPRYSPASPSSLCRSGRSGAGTWYNRRPFPGE